MIEVLQNLEPRHEHRGTMIFEELDDIREIIFIAKGQIDIGFEVNKQKRFAIRYTDRTLIGAYNCTFNIRAIFCYRATSDCEGFSIRKARWAKIIS